ncbi:hypothetical protein ACH5RR_041409 [Cinchona calisaya]|uniref:beta-fructofuranosidase n=1 Tax=Cinchona calisaya TaxID=153742 RepID=A0ABD2XYQ6_9GENT
MLSCMPNEEAMSMLSSAAAAKIRPAGVPRGVAEGVSAKSNDPLLLGEGENPFSWTNKMLAWQRSAFHFQPRKNWRNGPLFYKGLYHLFYPYNPAVAVWGNIVWDHAVSKDLIHWRHLPVAMLADQWYDQNGVWTGSATILPDGQLVMLYTGSTNESVQVQNLAFPADPSDPLLIKWVKYTGNPVIAPPPGIHFMDIRDPTTAWYTSNNTWQIFIDGFLHAVPETGMWECVGFYPVSRIHENGLDTSENGEGVKNVFKASFDDERNDYYAIGTYDGILGKWIPDDPKIDLGIGLRCDYENDSEAADITKGWASLQAIPRRVLLDKKTGSNVLQWPVEEVEKLRLNSKTFDDVEIKTCSIVPLDVGCASQLDILAEFEFDKVAKEIVEGTDVVYVCSASGGAVLTDKDQSEQTPVYFYIAKGTDGNFKTFFCADQSRSSEATDVNKAIYGSIVPVFEGEKLFMRILVDHSIVESFAGGGRTCITSRVYPTKAVYQDAQLFLFNNATNAKVNASLKVWQTRSVNIEV